MELAAESIRAQVDRLLQSKTFEGSEIHRHLLEYLVNKTIAGEADRLKEYTIALDAFGKPPTYDPKHDSVVRLQIGRLRQKLMAYYQTEAAGDPVLISLPKGAFKLSFEQVPARSNGSRNENGSPPAPNLRRILLLLAVALALVTIWAAVATIGLVRLHRQEAAISRQWSPELEQLWAPFLEGNRPLLICLGTPLFIRFPNFGFFRDPKANDWQEIDRSERIGALRKVLPDKDIIPWYAFTGTGEASAAVLLSKLLATRPNEVLLTRSNILSWQQIKDDNVVFIGPPKFNPQLQTAAMAQDIVIEPEGIRNLKPRAGEPVFLEDRIVMGKQSEGVTHALISRTSGPSGAGELLVIAGNASSDTFAAPEWLTDPRRAKELVSHLRGPAGEIPKHFQMVLRVEFKQGIPLDSSYVFHHALNAR